MPGLREIRTGSPPTGAPNVGGIGIGADFVGLKLFGPEKLSQ